MIRTRRTAALRDAGMTLVELMVYSAVSMLFLVVVVGAFLTSWQADAATRDRDAATSAAHVITNSIQASIRNSSGFRITGTLLQARVATGSAGWECRAWRLHPRTIAGETWYEFQYNHGNALIDNTSTGWANLLDGLNGGSGEGVFVRGNPTADKPFGEQGRLLTLSLSVTAVDLSRPNHASVPVSGDAVAQARGEGSPTTCWSS